MRLPTWEELESVEEQLDVLEWPLDKPLFVAGPPGSGKTVLAVHRAQMIAKDEPGIVILTYNRMLRRLMALLCEQSRKNAGHGATDFDDSIKTMQSYVWKDYKERVGTPPPPSDNDPYAYDWSEMLQVLETARIAPNKPRLVVDEGQDLHEGFFKYASRHISRTMSVFADDDQALAEQRTTLEQIKRTANLPDPVLLTQNHRNTPEIARLAEHFHTGRLPAATVRRSRSGERPRLLKELSLDRIGRLISNWVTNQGGSTGIIVVQNETGEQLRCLLQEQLPTSRVDCYTFKLKNEDQVNILEDGVTILNKESVKGQEFDAVFILELNRLLPCSSDSEKRSMYMMCSRARDNLWLICGPEGRLTQAIGNSLPGPEFVERV